MYSILHTSQVLLYHSLTSPQAQPAPTVLNLHFMGGQIYVKFNASICRNNFSYRNVCDVIPSMFYTMLLQKCQICIILAYVSAGENCGGYESR